MQHSSHSLLPGRLVTPPEDPVVIGHIARPVGVRGEVKVVFESRDAGRLEGMKTVMVRTAGGFRSFGIAGWHAAGRWIRLKLEGMESPEAAALLTGCEIVAEGGDRPDLPESEFYDDDIIGCSAVSDGGVELGLVEEIWHQGHHDLWVVQGPWGEILVPAVAEYILKVDLESHRIIVHHVPGLWEAGDEG